VFILFNTELCEVRFYDPDGEITNFCTYIPYIEVLISYLNKLNKLGNLRLWFNKCFHSLERIQKGVNSVLGCIIMIEHYVFGGELSNAPKFIDIKHGFNVCDIERLSCFIEKRAKQGICTSWE